MILLAHLLSRNWEWSRARIRLLRVVDDPDARIPSHRALTELITAARVNAKAEVIVSERPFQEVLSEVSRGSDCVFLGFELPPPEGIAEWQQTYERLFNGMPTTIMVCSREEGDLLA